MPMDGNKVSKILELIDSHYQGWTGVSDARFVKDEIEYKRAAAEKARELLGERELRRLIGESDYDGFVERLETMGRETNLLWLNIPVHGDLNVLYDDALDKPSFCEAVVDLMYGPGTVTERLGRYWGYVEERHLPNKWTFPTYFLFLLDPDEVMFVRPGVMKWLLEFVGEGEKYSSKPNVNAYDALVRNARELKNALAEYGLQDMVDVQSVIWVAHTEAKKGVSYWKIAPGDNAWQWDECREGGFIAVGWDELGDLSGVSRKEFEAKVNELVESLNWNKAGCEQVWRFAHLKEGDKVVANKGTSEVLGIGTVTGPYYFVPDTRHGHRLPVQWDDLTPRSVDEGGWRRTLIQLDEDRFEEVLNAPPAEGAASAVVSGDALFTEDAFRLMEELHKNPTQDFYSAHKDEFKEYVEGPIRSLFEEVARRLPPAIKDVMETEKRIFAKIAKNDFGRGGAWDYYWGAFYPKGGKRTEDAQLSIWINRDLLEFGFYVGKYGSEQQKRFFRNCKENREAITELLRDYVDDGSMLFGLTDDITTLKDFEEAKKTKLSLEKWLAEVEEHNIDASRILTKEEVLGSTVEELVNLCVNTYERLFPFVLLAISDTPLSRITDYIGEEEAEVNPEYPLDRCAADTFFDRDLLSQWVNAVERKGQAIIYGPPGTGKTFVARHLARHLVGGGDGFVEVVQFHPAYAYEDFVQGIRPKPGADGGLDYPVVPGRLLEFCREARTRAGKCVLIIDEINRANLSRVFGELMYLLEYRDEEVPLASGGVFRFPDNVRIIGTMNTADRSIALVDHALRRRFAFLALYPDYDVIAKYHTYWETGFPVGGLVDTLKKLNDVIADRHYEVGISYFLRENLESEIEDIWRMEVEPYLEEYFFDQPEKANRFKWDEVKGSVIG
jgi:5-methylcytosine-specific restriction protein B